MPCIEKPSQKQIMEMPDVDMDILISQFAGYNPNTMENKNRLKTYTSKPDCILNLLKEHYATHRLDVFVQNATKVIVALRWNDKVTISPTKERFEQALCNAFALMKFGYFSSP